MFISICDDEQYQQDYLAALVRRWSAEAKINLYPGAEAFKFDWFAGVPCDILLLDIQMGGQDGMALARELRETDNNLIIIFITALPDFMQEGYDVAALHYLVKPIDESKFFTVMEQAAKMQQRADKYILLPVEGEQVRFILSEILCVESFAHSIEISTKTASYTVKIPAYKLEEELGDDFIRTHRSYLVNMRYISRISKADVHLDTGKVIPLSRRLYNQVNKALLHYVRGKTR